MKAKDKLHPQATNGAHKRVRYALVALGNIAQVAVLPGFLSATVNSELVAFVSDDAKKRGRWQKMQSSTMLFL